jgi:hypothetical protein
MLLLAIICIAGTTQGQSMKQFKSEAEKAIEAKDFARSLDLYNKIINQADEKNADNYFKAAESARQFRIYSLAEAYYKEVSKDTVGLNRYRLTNFHLGTVLKSQARYDEAIRAFKKFIEGDAAFVNEEYTEKAKKEIIDCEWAKGVVENGTIIQHLDTTVNTPNSEFGPFEYNGELYYSSVRFFTDSKYEAIPPLSRIYTSDQIHDGEQVAEDFNKEENLHTGNVTFNAEGTRMYYTICNNVNVSDMHCKIYYRDKNGDAWGAVDSLSHTINSNTYTVTQPSVGIDIESGKEILFFVTDRLVDTTDHYRDLNIWCSFMEENGEWGEPGFIAEVNSEGEDVTPFFHTPTQTLYFSSNGLRNLGGFDVYSIQKTGTGWGEIKGMGSPLNSSYDEMYYTINTEGSFAYMSSNRPGGSCDPLDSLCVCNDIYRMPQICLEVRTFNELTGLPLFGTEVVLNETNMNSPTKQSKMDSHIYSFFVGFDRSYSVDGTKVDRWLPDMQEFNTFQSKGGGDCEIVDLRLTPLVDVNVHTCDKVTGEPLPGVNVKITLVDETDAGFPKSDKNGPDAQSNFKLNFGKKYKIEATKKGYSSDVSYRTMTEDIERIPTTLRDDLCLCKLPPPPDSLRLYFANDEPGPHTRRDTLAVSDYSNLVGTYSGRKGSFLDFFRKKNKTNSGGLNVDALKADTSNVNQFFKKVNRGKKRLEGFTSDLLVYLKLTPEGDSITVKIRGYASPIGPKDAGSYNEALSKRRIDSIRKYFKNNLPEDQYTKLRVVAEPNGSRNSPKTVPKFGESAIFGLDSSEERRVEIIGVELSTCIDLRNISTEAIPNDSY